MLLAPKKKLATIIVSKMKPDFVQKMGDKRDDEPMDMEKEGSEDPKTYAMEKFAEAVKAGEARKMAEAMEEFISMCNPDVDSSYSEE